VQGHTQKLDSIDFDDELATKPLRHVGKYEIREKIGEGGFGIVYKGFDPFIKRLVAIKTCTSPDETIRDRYFREAEIAGRLDHPHIVRIFDFGIEGGTPYLVQEFLAGSDLDHKIDGSEFVPYPERLLYLIHIARGLSYAHGRGVIHRDIKPANIRILDDGTAKIMDFGVAKLQHCDHRLTEDGMTVGTAAYLAPEQLEGKETDGRTDIFSFGVLAYELLTGRRPFDQDNISATLYAILHDDPRPMRLPATICPEAIQQLILDCLEKHPDGRPADFSTVLRRLEAIRRGMRHRSEDRDFDAELRQTSPRPEARPEMSGTARATPAESGRFDPPLQQEWTPDSIRIPERRSRKARLALALSVLVVGVASLWMARPEIVSSLVSPSGQFDSATPSKPRLEKTLEAAASRTQPMELETARGAGGSAAIEDSPTAPVTPSETDPRGTPNPAGSEDRTSEQAPVVPSQTEKAVVEPAPVEDATLQLQSSWHDQITVAVDGGQPVRLSRPHRHKLEPGSHTLAYSLVTSDYRAFETIRVDLEPGEERSIPNPIPRPGFLTVQASLGSPQGLIRVGGKSLGASPLRDLKLKPGRHPLEVASHQDPSLPLNEATIDIKSSRETVVTFDLTGQRAIAVRYRELESR